MILQYIAKSVFLAVNASLRRDINGKLLIYVIPTNHKWSIVVC
jgi:hypothetical protein